MKFDHTLTDTEMREIRTDREEIWQGRIFTVTHDTVRLPSGRISTRDVAWKRGAVCIVPVTDDGKIVCVEQYRYPYDKVILEIPAGKLEESEDDHPLEAAKRELAEETGYTAAEWIDFGVYYGSPAMLKEEIFIYLARGLTAGDTNFDEGEYLRIREIPIETITEQILNGEIPDGKTQAAVLRAKLWLEREASK
ncbi:MAG: NUDIX hydrolase [Clostridia bacterium]|nr:NUDIX hydrolase [Clostridia bacterium]